MKTVPSFEKSFASHPKSASWSSRNEVLPSECFKGSPKKFWFLCNCSHEFQSSLNSISLGQWCPYCCSPPQKLCDSVECESCFNKSFASNPKSKCIVEDSEIIARLVFKSSGKKCVFVCDNCCHSFESTLNSVDRGRWCPYCCVPPKQLCDKEDCKECFEISFASHHKSHFWSATNTLKPRDVFKNSHTKYKFNCESCNHEFDCVLNDVVQGSWCLYCGKKKLCSDKDCSICLQRSFLSHPNSKYWSHKNPDTPRTVFLNSSKKYFFDCNVCNYEFESSVSHISNGSWCPKCKHKTELKLLNWLTENLSTTIHSQHKFSWSKTEKSYRRFDFFIELFKILIELDGPQHFKPISNWKDYKETQIIDEEKNSAALVNGYSMIRICQETVLFDRNNWQQELLNAVKHLKLQTGIIKIGNVYPTE